MTEVHIEETPEEETEELGEHEAAKAAGAAEVHQEGAEEAAEEAEAAAQAAMGAAEAAIGSNTDSVMAAEEAASRAEESATAANSGAEAVAQAITAQTTVLQSLLDKLNAPQESATPKEPVKKSADRAPSRKRRSGLGDRYFGG